jgi:hypothetical protein
VQWSELVGEWVRELLQYNRCELLLWEADSWATGIVREPRGRGTSSVGSRYQATTSEDSRLRRLSTYYNELQSVWISDSATVTCRNDLQVFNRLYYQSKPVYSHTKSRDSIVRNLRAGTEGRHWESSGRVAGVSAEIWTKHLSNKSLQRYSQRALFGD